MVYLTWTDGAECIHGLAYHPLTTILLKLPVPRAYIVGNRVSSNVGKGILFFDTATLFSNDDHQLNLPVKLFHLRNEHDRLAVGNNRAGELGE